MIKLLTQAWLIMRLATFIVLAGTLHLSAAGYSQTVTYTARKAPILSVLRAIEQQTGYVAFTSEELLKNSAPVTVQFSNTPIEEVLQALFIDQPLDYELKGKNILIKEAVRRAETRTDGDRGNSINRVPENGSLLILAIPTVTGRITDTLGQPLAGASVVVLSPEGKRTSLQTTTKANGIFVLENVPEEAMLRISFMGYVERQVQARAQMGNVVLKPSESPLDEVQVIAYGTTTRRLSTGNTTTVKAEDIEKQPVANPLLAIQGRVSGLVVTQNTGVPGGGVTVRIQGQNSIGKGNSPLFVVDGVPIESNLSLLNGQGFIGHSGPTDDPGLTGEGNPLNYINPTDIESIDVLKDADATAIFGSRAANGAILITTKKGKAGKMNLSVNMNNGWSKAASNGFKLMNTREYLDMRYEAFRNDGIDWRDPAVYAPDLKLWDTTRYTDWQKEIAQRTALSQHVQAAVSGGVEQITYRLSGTYDRQSSLFPDRGNGNPRAAVSMNLGSISINQKLRVQLSANYQYNHNEMAGVPLSFMLLMAPNTPEPLNPDGTVNWAPDENGNSSFYFNPYARMYNLYQNTTTNLIGNLVLGYKILKELEFNANLGYTNMGREDFVPFTSNAIRPEDQSFVFNSALYGSGNNRSVIVEPSLKFDKDTRFGKIGILLGNTLREANDKRTAMSGLDYPSDAILDNLGAARILNPPIMEETEQKYLAFFGRLNYLFKDRYVLNVNARRDGSSRFGENKRFNDFWSIGGAWIFTQHPFLNENVPWLSFGKLRASYGITGSDQIGDYQFIRIYDAFFRPAVPYQGIATVRSTRLPNPDLEWERTRKLSTGLELGFLKDRIVMSMGYSRNVTDNQLLSYPLSTVTGAGSITRNLPGKVGNTTWEFGLNTVNVKTSAWEWSTSLNISQAINKLLAYPDFETSGYANILKVGQPITIRRINRFAGVNSATGEYQYLDKNGNPTTTPSYPDDRMEWVNMAPFFYGGMENRVRWKRFDFSFHLQFSKQNGNDYYHIGNTNGWSAGNFARWYEMQNQPASVVNRWRQPGDRATIAKYTTVTFTNLIASSDAFYTDASFIRLKNASFSWTMPESWSKKVGLKSARILASGQNLLTLTRYDGPDPETNDLTTLPPLCAITLGVNVIL